MTPPELELLDALTSESAWLHGLARRLVRDPERAADAAQRTLLTALERRPERRASLRGWLSVALRRVLREEHRGEVRRGDREALANEPRFTPTPDQTLARLDVQQKVVAAIRALDEPYRSTLVQRFLDGRSVREIARRSGLPHKTVHTRVERGLARLRARLDREHGGDRSAWLGALLALRLDSIGPLGMGVGAMQAGTKTLAATVAFVVVLGSTAWMLVGRGGEGAELTPAIAAAQPAEEPRVEAQSPPPLPVERARSAVTQEQTRVEEPTVEPALALLSGRVENEGGLPVPNARVLYVGEDGKPLELEPALSDSRGAFSLPLPPEGEEAYLSAQLAGFTLLARPYLHHALPESELVLVLLRSKPIAGFVVDEFASPVAGARVRVSIPGALFDQRTGGAWVFDRPSWEARSDEGGAFRMAEAPVLAGMTIGAERDGYLPATRELEARDGVELVLRSAGAEADVVGGEVVDERGAPVEGALVSTGRHSASTDANGRFALDLSETRERIELCALRRGALPARQTLEAGAEGFPFVTLQLGGAPPSLRGRVLDELGEPVAGAIVSLLETTPFGQVPEEQSGMRVDIHRDVEWLLAGCDEPGARRVTSDSAGHFELDGLLPRAYRVIALDPRTLAGAGPLTFDAGRAELELHLAGLGERRAAAGRVVTRAGTPIPGVEVSLGCLVGGASLKYRNPTAAETDAEGRFALPPFHVRGAHLVLDSMELSAPVAVILDERDDLSALELVAGVVCYARVTLDDPQLANALAFLDADGEALNIGFDYPGMRLIGRRVSVTNGNSGPLRTDDRARHLVLYRGVEEVYRCPVELAPGAETELRVP